MSAQKYPVGIDLGTTFSSLAWLDEEGRPEVLRFMDEGSSLSSTTQSMASAIYFKNESEIIVGNRALEFGLIDSSRLARAFKRHIGDPKFDFSVDGKNYRPEELSAMVLKKIHQAAEAKLGPVEEAVISVPFVFNQSRREATRDAALIAGFKKVDLIDEPVAAALAYGQKLFFRGGAFDYDELNDLFTDEVLLVYDLGGGTFDATIMRLGQNNVFGVIATDGDERLGGEDWDNIMLERVCSEYERKTGVNPLSPGQENLLHELRLKAIETKKSLSDKPRAILRFSHDSQDHEILLAVGDFRADSRHLLERTTSTIREMLNTIDKEVNFIDRVLIVGGASRMPMVAQHLRLVMDNRDFDMSVSPDTAIAEGAAVYAGLQLGRANSAGIKGVETVNSHPLGLKVKDPNGRPVNDVFIKANEKTERSVSRRYLLQNNRAVTLTVLEGDQKDPMLCVQLGEVRAGDLPSGLDKHEPIDVHFQFQENGLLKVEGEIRNPNGGAPIRPQLKVLVDGAMSLGEKEIAAKTLRGISID